MKRRTIGRYWTKRVLREFEESDFDEDGRLKPELDDTYDDGPPIDQTFAASIDRTIAYCGKFLRKRELPDCPGMVFAPGRPDEWEASPEWRIRDSRGARCNWFPLTEYLRKYRGVKYDTLEDLAARIINAAYRLKDSADHDLAMKHAHELGRLETLFSVYSKLDETRQKPRPKKRRAWAEKLAEDLKTCASRDEAWSTIEGSEETDEPNIKAGGRRWIVYRDGDDLVAKDYHTYADEKIRRTTFLRHYLKLNRR